MKREAYKNMAELLLRQHAHPHLMQISERTNQITLTTESEEAFTE